MMRAFSCRCHTTHEPGQRSRRSLLLHTTHHLLFTPTRGRHTFTLFTLSRASYPCACTPWSLLSPTLPQRRIVSSVIGLPIHTSPRTPRRHCTSYGVIDATEVSVVEAETERAGPTSQTSATAVAQASHAARSRVLPSHFSPINELDLFARARVVNFIRRYRRDGKAELPASAVFTVTCVNADTPLYHAYARLPLRHPDGERNTQQEQQQEDDKEHRVHAERVDDGVTDTCAWDGHVYAHGVAASEKAAITVAAMHAERIIDALGFHLYTLPSTQRRHAAAARRAGRFAPMPDEGGKTVMWATAAAASAFPLPLRHGDANDAHTGGSGSESGTWQLVDVRPHRWVVPGEAIFSPTLLDAGAQTRITHFLHEHGRRWSECGVVVKQSARTHNKEEEKEHEEEARGSEMYVAALTLPVCGVSARGKARTAAMATCLVCMHAELLLDALHIPLFPRHPSRQCHHARQAWSAGRPAPLPRTPPRSPAQCAPLPLPLKEDTRTCAVSHSAPGALLHDDALFFARHRQLAACVTTWVNTTRCHVGAVAAVRALLRTRGSHRWQSPFLYERVGRWIRCTVVIPVPDHVGLCGGVGWAKRATEARVLAAMHAWEEWDVRRVAVEGGGGACSAVWASAAVTHTRLPGRRWAPRASARPSKSSVTEMIKSSECAQHGVAARRRRGGGVRRAVRVVRGRRRRRRLTATTTTTTIKEPLFDAQEGVNEAEALWRAREDAALPTSCWSLVPDGPRGTLMVTPRDEEAVFAHALACARGRTFHEVSSTNALERTLHSVNTEETITTVSMSKEESPSRSTVGVTLSPTRRAALCAEAAQLAPWFDRVRLAALLSPRHLDAGAAVRLQRYISRRGFSRLRHVLHMTRMAESDSVDGATAMFRCRIDLLLTDAERRRAAAITARSRSTRGRHDTHASVEPLCGWGEASRAKEAVMLAAMHAELTLDALGVCLCADAARQRQHAAACARVGRWAPRRGGDVPPTHVRLPPPLRREPSHTSWHWIRALNAMQHTTSATLLLTGNEVQGEAKEKEGDEETKTSEACGANSPAEDPNDEPNSPCAPHSLSLEEEERGEESAQRSDSPDVVGPSEEEHMSIARQELDAVSKMRVQYYLRRQGQSITRVDYRMHMTRHAVRHTASWHLPLPARNTADEAQVVHVNESHTTAFARAVVRVCGEAATKREADTLAWMHAERTLVALGIPLFDNLPGLQHWHRTRIASAWKWVPPMPASSLTRTLAAHTDEGAFDADELAEKAALGCTDAVTHLIPRHTLPLRARRCVLVDEEAEEDADGPLPPRPCEFDFATTATASTHAEDGWERYAEACAVYIDARAMRQRLRALRLARVPRTGEAWIDRTLDEVESAAVDGQSVALLRAYRAVCESEEADTDEADYHWQSAAPPRCEEGAGRSSSSHPSQSQQLANTNNNNKKVVPCTEDCVPRDAHDTDDGDDDDDDGLLCERTAPLRDPPAAAAPARPESWLVRLVGSPRRRVYLAMVRLPGWEGLWGSGVAEEKQTAQQRAAMHALALLRRLDGDAEDRLACAREQVAMRRAKECDEGASADDDVVVMLDDHTVDPTMLIHADANRLSSRRHVSSATSTSGSSGGGGATNSNSRRYKKAVIVGQMEEGQHGNNDSVASRTPSHDPCSDRTPSEPNRRSAAAARVILGSPTLALRRRGVTTVVDAEVQTLTVAGKLRVLRLYAAGAASRRIRTTLQLIRHVRLHPDDPHRVDYRTVVTLTEAYDEEEEKEEVHGEPSAASGVWRGESGGCGPRRNTRRAVADLFAHVSACVPAVRAWESVLRAQPLLHPDDVRHVHVTRDMTARLRQAIAAVAALPPPPPEAIRTTQDESRGDEKRRTTWTMSHSVHGSVRGGETAANGWGRVTDAHLSSSSSLWAQDSTTELASSAAKAQDAVIRPSGDEAETKRRDVHDGHEEEEEEDEERTAAWADLRDRLRRKVVHPDYVERYATARSRLSIAAHRQAILDAMAAYPVVIVCGTTGCGKTTQVPQYILDSLTERDGLSLSSSSCTVLSSSPPKPQRGSIWVTQPRRLSAVSIAQRVCAERMEELTDVCGYVIRFDTRPGRHINFCTPAILLRTLYTAPHLDGIDYLIIDEIHERDMHTDFLLMLLRQSILAKRPELRVVLMSATLHAEQFSRYFGGAPIISVEGYVYPVRELFVEDLVPLARACRVTTPLLKEVAAATEHGDGSSSSSSSSALVASDTASFRDSPRRRYDVLPSLVEIDYAAVQFAVSQARRLVDLSQSSILVFLPGWEEITHAKAMLEREPAYHIITLHSSNAVEEQMRCFVPAAPGRIKLILSTNIAESGVTIDDVGAVIDVGCLKEKSYLTDAAAGGWGGLSTETSSSRARAAAPRASSFDASEDAAADHNDVSEEEWDAGVGAAQLLTVYASRANCVQRRGRVGRTRPGVCIRLYSRAHFAALHDFQTPEMLRTPLDGLCLHILALGLGAPEEVLAGALEPPRPTAVHAALVRLLSLRAMVPVTRRPCALPARVSAFGAPSPSALANHEEAAATRSTSAHEDAKKEEHHADGPRSLDYSEENTPPSTISCHAVIQRSSSSAASSSTATYALTALGARLAVLPLEPRLGKVVLTGAMLGCFDAALTAAVTTESDVYLHAREHREAVRLHREDLSRHTLSDAVASVNGFLFWRRCHTRGRAPEVMRRLEERQLHIPHLLHVSRTKRQVTEMLRQTHGLLSSASTSVLQSCWSTQAAASVPINAGRRRRRRRWGSVGEVHMDDSILSRHSDEVNLLRTALCAGLLPCLAHHVAMRQLCVCVRAAAGRVAAASRDGADARPPAATMMLVQTSPDSVLHKFRHHRSPEPLLLYTSLFRPRDSRHLVADGLTAVSLWSVLITAPPTMSLTFDRDLSVGVLDGWVMFHTTEEVVELVTQLRAAWATCVEYTCAEPARVDVNEALVTLSALIRELVHTPLPRGLSSHT